MGELPKPIIELRKLISKMPGFSERGAERFLEWWWEHNEENGYFYKNWADFIKFKPCRKCFLFASEETCDFCLDEERDSSRICVVSSAFTAYLVEKEASFNGLYFVLGGEIVGSRNYKLLESIKKRLYLLKNRVINEKIPEVIIATDFTSRGETTALFIKDYLKGTPVKISRLAQGFHPGDSLGYGDPVTLKKAFENRQNYGS